MVCVCGLVFAEQAAKPGVVGLKRERKPSRDLKNFRARKFWGGAGQPASRSLHGLLDDLADVPLLELGPGAGASLSQSCAGVWGLLAPAL